MRLAGFQGRAAGQCKRQTQLVAANVNTLFIFAAPTGAEACSPALRRTSLFLSVQHPGELRIDDIEVAETLDEACTSWPDVADGMPARPSLVVLTKRDGGVVGNKK